MLVYTAIIGGVFVFMLSGMIALWRSSQEARLSRLLDGSGSAAMDRIVREARDGKSVITASSTLGTNPGVLAIGTDNASTTGGAYTFAVSNNVLQITDTAGSLALTPSTLKVESLIFWLATSTNSQSIRTRMRLLDTASTTGRVFYGSAVLRGSYAQ